MHPGRCTAVLGLCSHTRSRGNCSRYFACLGCYLPSAPGAARTQSGGAALPARLCTRMDPFCAEPTVGSTPAYCLDVRGHIWLTPLADLLQVGEKLFGVVRGLRGWWTSWSL